MSLQEFRDQFPKYDGMSDEELLARIYRQHYSNKMTPDEFIQKMARRSGPNLAEYKIKHAAAKADARRLVDALGVNENAAKYIRWRIDEAGNTVRDDLPKDSPRSVLQLPPHERELLRTIRAKGDIEKAVIRFADQATAEYRKGMHDLWRAESYYRSAQKVEDLPNLWDKDAPTEGNLFKALGGTKQGQKIKRAWSAQAHAVRSGILDFASLLTRPWSEKTTEELQKRAELFYTISRGPDVAYEAKGWEKIFTTTAGAIPYIGVAAAGVMGVKLLGAIGLGTASVSTLQKFSVFLTAFGVEGNGIYRDAKANGKEETEARLRGVIGGTINGLIEAASGGVGKYFKKKAVKKATAKAIIQAKKGSGPWGRILKNAIKEGLAEEMPQELVSTVLGAEVPHDEDGNVNWDQLTDRILEAGKAGFTVGAVMESSIGRVMQHDANLVAAKMYETRMKKFEDAVGELATKEFFNTPALVEKVSADFNLSPEDSATVVTKAIKRSEKGDVKFSDALINEIETATQKITPKSVAENERHKAARVVQRTRDTDKLIMNIKQQRADALKRGDLGQVVEFDKYLKLVQSEITAQQHTTKGPEGETATTKISPHEPPPAPHQPKPPGTLNQNVGNPSFKSISETNPDIAHDPVLPEQLQVVKGLMQDLNMTKQERANFARHIIGDVHAKDMTISEADKLINSLSLVRSFDPDNNGRAGNPRAFKEPGGAVNVTPLWRTILETGLSPIIDPATRAKIDMDHDVSNTVNNIKREIVLLNKIDKTSRREAAKSRVKNVPTRAESRIAIALNESEIAPDWLTKEEAVIFDWFRNLTHDILALENSIRRERHMEVIPTRQAYFKHILKDRAEEILQLREPVPTKLSYWADKVKGRKLWNPSEFERYHEELENDLGTLFENDLEYVMASMVRTAYREIYLNEPLGFAQAMLDYFMPSKKTIEELNLRGVEELRRYEMPKELRQFADEYLGIFIRDEQSNTDARINHWVKNLGLEEALNKVLAPFGRSLSKRPISSLTSHLTALVRTGAMGWRPKLLARNLFQNMQNMALYGIKDTVRALFPVSPALREMIKNTQYIKTYTGLEDAPPGTINRFEKAWQAPYVWTATVNARNAMKAAYYSTMSLIENPKYAKHGWADPQRNYKEEAGFLYPSEKEKLLKEMEHGARSTQYQYIAATMPWIYRHKTLRFATQFMSWPMNYFFNFHKEALHRMFKGKPSWSNGEVTLPWSRRMGYGKYLLIGGKILTEMGYTSSFALGAAPAGFPPLATFLVAFYNWAKGPDEQRDWRVRQMTGALKLLIPGHLAGKDLLKVMETGDYTGYLSYKKKDKGGSEKKLKRKAYGVSAEEMRKRQEARKKVRKK